MKILAAYSSGQDAGQTMMKIMVWPDSAMIRSGKPVFLHEERGYYGILAIMAKIDAVGKTILPKYAGKYYTDIAPGLFILKENVARDIENHIDPAACDIVEDYSVVCGEWLPLNGNGNDLAFNISLNPLHNSGLDQEIEKNINIDNPEGKIGEAVSAASARNTLKTGDSVALLTSMIIPLYPNTLLRIETEGKTLLENKLK